MFGWKLFKPQWPPRNSVGRARAGGAVAGPIARVIAVAARAMCVRSRLLRVMEIMVGAPIVQDMLTTHAMHCNTYIECTQFGRKHTGFKKRLKYARLYGGAFELSNFLATYGRNAKPTGMMHSIG